MQKEAGNPGSVANVLGEARQRLRGASDRARRPQASRVSRAYGLTQCTRKVYEVAHLMNDNPNRPDGDETCGSSLEGSSRPVLLNEKRFLIGAGSPTRGYRNI